MKPPTRQQVTDVITEKGYSIDPFEFHDYYVDCEWTVPDAKGKKHARKPMISWRSCLRTWQANMDKTTSFVNVNKREEQYIKEKAVYTLPAKKKASNPKILELNKEIFALESSKRGVSRNLHIQINIKMRAIRTKIVVLKDEDTRLITLVTTKRI